MIEFGRWETVGGLPALEVEVVDGVEKRKKPVLVGKVFSGFDARMRGGVLHTVDNVKTDNVPRKGGAAYALELAHKKLLGALGSDYGQVLNLTGVSMRFRSSDSRDTHAVSRYPCVSTSTVELSRAAPDDVVTCQQALNTGRYPVAAVDLTGLHITPYNLFRSLEAMTVDHGCVIFPYQSRIKNDILSGRHYPDFDGPKFGPQFLTVPQSEHNAYLWHMIALSPDIASNILGRYVFETVTTTGSYVGMVFSRIVPAHLSPTLPRDTPLGLCYLSVIQAKYRESVMNELGLSPSVRHLLTLPKHYFCSRSFLSHTYELIGDGKICLVFDPSALGIATSFHEASVHYQRDTDARYRQSNIQLSLIFDCEHSCSAMTSYGAYDGDFLAAANRDFSSLLLSPRSVYTLAAVEAFFEIPLITVSDFRGGTGLPTKLCCSRIFEHNSRYHYYMMPKLLVPTCVLLTSGVGLMTPEGTYVGQQFGTMILVPPDIQYRLRVSVKDLPLYDDLPQSVASAGFSKLFIAAKPIIDSDLFLFLMNSRRALNLI